MRIYFGGCDRTGAIKTVLKAGGKRAMVSFASPPSKNCWDLMRQNGMEILADSGAFTVWKKGGQIDINAYMAWINKNQLTQYFNLDVVGNPEATAANQAIMESAGFEPIPVFHYGEPMELLEKLCGRYSLIGLGGTVGLPFEAKDAWIREVIQRHPNTKFHGLGVTEPRLLTEHALYSVDSVWWLSRHRKGAKFSDYKLERNNRVEKLLWVERNACAQGILFASSVVC